MQDRATVKHCMSMHIESSRPFVCGFEQWCAKTCDRYPAGITARRIDPKGSVQARLAGSRRWVKRGEWMTTREAWNSIEDWEDSNTPDRKDMVACATGYIGGSQMKNVSADKGEAKNVSENGAEHDPVNHPSHYASGDVECIDAIRSCLMTSGLNPYQGFLVGNALKYLWRFNTKGNPVQDLDKADWYRKKLRDTFTGVK